jgi:hypothetical protein
MCCIHAHNGSVCQHRPCLWLSKEGNVLARRRFGVRCRVSRKVSGLMGEGTNGVYAASTDRRLASRTFLPSPMERPRAPVQPCQRRPCFTLPCWLAVPALLSPSPMTSACFLRSSPAAVPCEVASSLFYAGVVLRAETAPRCVPVGSSLATRTWPSGSWS